MKVGFFEKSIHCFIGQGYLKSDNFISTSGWQFLVILAHVINCSKRANLVKLLLYLSKCMCILHMHCVYQLEKGSKTQYLNQFFHLRCFISV